MAKVTPPQQYVNVNKTVFSFFLLPRCGVEPPGLVKLEREIEREEAGSSLSPSLHVPFTFFPCPPGPRPSPPPSPATPPSPSPPCPAEPPVAPCATDLPLATTNAAPACPPPPQSPACSPCTSSAATQTPLLSPPCAAHAPDKGSPAAPAKRAAAAAAPPAALPSPRRKSTPKRSAGAGNVLDEIV